jgi:nitrogen fixation protein NifU and related proteins
LSAFSRDNLELDIYAEILIAAYEHPEHKGRIENADVKMFEENISCGDKITVYLKLDKGKVKDAKFDGLGCVISMGSAEILLEELRGKTLEQLEKMTREDLLKLISIDPGPVRMHCATLALRAAKKAAFEYEKKPIDRATKEL